MEIFFFSHHKGSAPLNGGRLSGRSAEGGQPSARVRGVPENPFSSRLLAACGGEREKRGSWGHPRPRQGEPCTPSGHPPVKGELLSQTIMCKNRIGFKMEIVLWIGSKRQLEIRA